MANTGKPIVDLIKRVTTKVGTVENLHGNVFTPTPAAPRTLTAGWYMVQGFGTLPRTVSLTAEDLPVNLSSTNGVTSFRYNPTWTTLVYSGVVLNIPPQSPNQEVPFTIEAPDADIALYVNDNLVLRGNSSLRTTALLGNGKSVIQVVITGGNGNATITTREDLPLGELPFAPPVPEWTDPALQYDFFGAINGVGGAKGINVTWASGEFANYYVLERTSYEAVGSVESVTQEDELLTFTLNGDRSHFQGVLLAGNAVIVGNIYSATYDDITDETSIECVTTLEDLPVHEWVGSTLYVSASRATIATVERRGLITSFTDVNIKDNTPYTYRVYAIHPNHPDLHSDYTEPRSIIIPAFSVIPGAVFTETQEFRWVSAVYNVSVQNTGCEVTYLGTVYPAGSTINVTSSGVLTAHRPPLGEPYGVLTFSAEKDGVVETNEFTVLAIDAGEATVEFPDLTVTQVGSTNTSVSYTASAVSTVDNSPIPVLVNLTGVTATVGGSNFPSGSVLPVGSILVVARPDFGQGSGTVQFSASVPGGGSETIQRTVIPVQQDTVQLFVRATPLPTENPEEMRVRVAVADPQPGTGNVTLRYTSQGVAGVTPASPQTIPAASITQDIDTTGYIDFTIQRPQSGLGRVTWTAEGRGRVQNTDSADVPEVSAEQILYTECRARLESSTATTATIRVEAEPPEAQVELLAGSTATRTSGPTPGTRSPSGTVWVFSRPNPLTNPTEAIFRATLDGYVSDDDHILITEQARDTVALVMRARVQSSTATQVVVRVAVSDPVDPTRAGNITVTPVQNGTGGVTPSTAQTIAAASVTSNLDTTGFIDFTITRPSAGSGGGRVVFTATRSGRVADSDSIDVPEVLPDIPQVTACMPRITASDGDTVTVTVDATPSDAQVQLVSLRNATRISGPNTGVASPRNTVWVFSRPNYRSGQGEVVFRALAADHEPHEQVVSINERAPSQIAVNFTLDRDRVNKDSSTGAGENVITANVRTDLPLTAGDLSVAITPNSTGITVGNIQAISSTHFRFTITVNIPGMAVGEAEYFAVLTIATNNGEVRSTARFVVDNSPPDAVDNFQVVRGFQSLSLSWDQPEGDDISHYRIRWNTVNDLNTAGVLRDHFTGTNFTHTNLTAEGTRYYWVEAVDSVGLRSAPVTGSNYPDTVAAIDIPPGYIDEHHFADNLEPIKLVNSLPNTTAADIGKVVFLTTDGRLYRCIAAGTGGAGWTAATPSEYGTQNILGAGAGDTVSITGVGSRSVLSTTALEDLGLAPGDIVSVSCDIITDGNDNRARIQLIFRDAENNPTYIQPGIYNGTTWERRIRENVEIPQDAVTLTVAYRQEVNSVGTATFRRAMLNRGPVALPYEEPPVRISRETLQQLQGEIQTGQIAANAIRAAHIDADAVESQHIAANAVTADKILAGEIKSAHIASSAVTASKLLITDTTNIVQNPSFDTGDTAGWSKVAPVIATNTLPDSANAPAKYCVALDIQEAGNNTLYANDSVRIDVVPGESFYVAVSAMSTPDVNERGQIGIVWERLDGSLFYSGVPRPVWETAQTTWDRKETLLVVPEEATKMNIYLQTYGTANPQGVWYFTDVRWRKATSSTLIEDGAVTTHKISAGSVDASKLNVVSHFVENAVWSNNTPGAGRVSWSACQLYYDGVRYDISAGSNSNTSQTHIWWRRSTPGSFRSSTQATFDSEFNPANGDALIALNEGGIANVQWNATEISGGAIKTNSLHGGKIIAESITADKLAAGEITTAKLMVGSFDNLAQNPNFSASSTDYFPHHPQTNAASWSVSQDFARSGVNSLRLNTATQSGNARMDFNGAGWLVDSGLPTAAVGDLIYGEFWVRCANAGPANRVSARMYMRSAEATSLGSVATTITPTTTWQKVSVIHQAPNGTVKSNLVAVVHADNHVNDIYITDIYWRKMVTGDLIVDGSITTNHLKFRAAEADKIVAQINESEEGIRISSDKIRIDGSVMFANNYDPTTKETPAGATTKANNARDAAIAAAKDYTDSVVVGLGDGNVVIRANTAPTTRPGGSTLRNGDIWLKSNEGDLPHVRSGSNWVRMYTIIDGGNIQTGTIDAARITIGSASNFENGYDPSANEGALNLFGPTAGDESYADSSVIKQEIIPLWSVGLVEGDRVSFGVEVSCPATPANRVRIVIQFRAENHSVISQTLYEIAAGGEYNRIVDENFIIPAQTYDILYQVVNWDGVSRTYARHMTLNRGPKIQPYKEPYLLNRDYLTKGTTTIDGGKITAESITADQIAVGVLRSFDNKFVIDAGGEKRLTVRDDAVDRVILGGLPNGDFGLEIRDSAGQMVLSADGSLGVRHNLARNAIVHETLNGGTFNYEGVYKNPVAVYVGGGVTWDNRSRWTSSRSLADGYGSGTQAPPATYGIVPEFSATKDTDNKTLTFTALLVATGDPQPRSIVFPPGVAGPGDYTTQTANIPSANLPALGDSFRVGFHLEADPAFGTIDFWQVTFNIEVQVSTNGGSSWSTVGAFNRNLGGFGMSHAESTQEVTVTAPGLSGSSVRWRLRFVDYTDINPMGPSRNQLLAGLDVNWQVDANVRYASATPNDNTKAKFLIMDTV